MLHVTSHHDESDESPSPQKSASTANGSERNKSVDIGKDRRPVTKVEADEALDSIAVSGRILDLAGSVRGDIVAIGSDVILRRGASVGGHVLAIDSSVNNAAGDSIRIDSQSAAADSGGKSASWVVSVPASEQASAPAPKRSANAEGRKSWGGEQFALLLLGLLGAAVAVMGAPRATDRVAATIVKEPARCLAAGAIAVAAMLGIALVNAGMLHMLTVFWAPVGWVIASLFLVALGFAWVAGMKCVGDYVAKALHDPLPSGMFARIATGLGLFFAAKLLLGMVGIGAVGLIAEAGIVVLGVGAVIITGGGMDTDWLGVRLRRERRWFS